MRKIDKWLMNMATWAKIKTNEFLYEEDGDVNIVSMVVLVGIAVLLAVLFKDSIKELLETLLDTIKGNAEDAIN